MAKLPYGGVGDEAPASNAPIKKLHLIAEALERNEPLNPEHARWLGDAILRAGNKKIKLLKNLGLIEATAGKPSLHSGDDWLTYGQQLADLESEGYKTAQAIRIIEHNNPDRDLPRNTLIRWRNKYLTALDEIREIDAENNAHNYNNSGL